MALSRTIAFVAVVAACPLYAQDWKGSGRLEGKVTDGQGHPVAGALVKLDLPSRGSTQLKTDAKGHWAILGLANGQWNLDFSAEGYGVKKISVTVSESERLPPITTKLEKTEGSPGAVGKEANEALDKGDAAFKEGKYAEARDQYQKLLVLRPDLAKKPEVVKNIHWRIARAYAQEKNFQGELDELQLALDAEPGDNDLKKLMFQEAFQGGFFDRGVEILKKVDDSALQDPDVLYNIGVAFYNHQKVDEAIAYLDKALTLVPKYADAYFLRGNCYLNLNKVPLAKADYAKFVELAPDDPKAPAAKKALEQLK